MAMFRTAVGRGNCPSLSVLLATCLGLVFTVTLPPRTVQAFVLTPHVTSGALRGPVRRWPATRCQRTIPTSAPVSVRNFRALGMAVGKMCVGEFNQAEIAEHLEHDYKGDLALLAQKFGTMIESIDDIEEVHVSELDGDHMSLEVVYCDHSEQTCVAVAVPIKFPYHCDDENGVIHAIHDLEEMEDVEVSNEVQLPKKKLSPELMETIARIAVVMNRDFQDELASFVRAFGGPGRNRPTGECKMISLTPDGFVVQAALFPEEPVTVTFSMECISAADFQTQILAISEQAMTLAAP